ncbi:BON domain-containing protein [Shewanella livingstonensis]|uniref:Small-conductance mechanosensitive channel n=1 Tax=Shewanella livingstonensis TaxID=150120 RepID=A0A3G8LZE6_9GAMM|nr:mechanosensitive ion channel family protein [Shewanella livingstonensis]AZG75001.1 BON domain-containing protein [Shewanella livingstonensis]
MICRFFLHSVNDNNQALQPRLNRWILLLSLVTMLTCLTGITPNYAQAAPSTDTVQQLIKINDPSSELKVEINGSVVKLTGTITELESKQRIINTIAILPGVTDVVDNIQLHAMEPLSLAPLQHDAQQFWTKTLQYLPNLALGLAIFLVLFWLSHPLARLLIRPLTWVTQSELIRLVMQRSFSVLIILLGLYIFLRLAGLTQFAVAIISSTGVIGLILGFAFKDIAENFISSLLLSVQRPFKLGDVIAVEGHLGVVKKVTARATTLVDYDGNHIQIPNATIYKNVIKNLTANPRMRGHFVIGIGYDAGVRKAQDIAMEIMNAHHGVLADPEPQVLIKNLGSSTINLQVYFWVNAETHSVPKVASILMRMLVRAYEANEISMPDDARERIFPQGLQLVPSEHLHDDSLLSTKHITPQSTEQSIQQARQQQNKKAQQSMDEAHNGASDDISSDTDDIRQQAAQSRDPETGANII